MSILKDKIELEIAEAELKAQKKLNAFPPLLKWLLIGCVIAIIPAYFATKAISQKIWATKLRQYQITAKPSFVNPLPPKITNVTVLAMADGTYAGVAEISNVNLDLALDATPYRFDFFDRAGNLVYSDVDEKLYLLPDQKKYVVVSRISTIEKITSAKLELAGDLPWKKRLSLPNVKLTPSLPYVYNQADPQAFAAEGNVYNNSPYTIKQVNLIFIVKDLKGKTVAVSQRSEFDIKPYERRGYKQLWPGINLSSNAQVTVLADTNILDNANLTLVNVPTGKASDLSRPESGSDLQNW